MKSTALNPTVLCVQLQGFLKPVTELKNISVIKHKPVSKAHIQLKILSMENMVS